MGLYRQTSNSLTSPKFRTFHGNRKFNAVFTTANHLSQFWARWIQSKPFNTASLRLEFCALLRYYAARSVNSLSTFRENLSLPSSRLKNPRNRSIRCFTLLSCLFLGLASCSFPSGFTIKTLTPPPKVPYTHASDPRWSSSNWSQEDYYYYYYYY